MRDEPSTHLLTALRGLTGELTARNRLVGAMTGLRESDLAVLDLLHRDGPQVPTVLARRIRVHPATMTGILTRLQREGWIERRSADGDLRSFNIHPTSIDRLTELFAPANAALADLFQNWPQDQVAALVGLINEAAQTVLESTDALASTDARSKGTKK